MQRHTHTCQGQPCSLHLKARKKAVCIHGGCLEEEGWLVSCAHNTTQAWGLGNSLTPLSASITPHHCDGQKSCLRISQKKKVPFFIPPLSPHCVEKWSQQRFRRRRRSGERTELCTNVSKTNSVCGLIKVICLTNRMCSWYKQGNINTINHRLKMTHRLKKNYVSLITLSGMF